MRSGSSCALLGETACSRPTGDSPQWTPRGHSRRCRSPKPGCRLGVSLEVVRQRITPPSPPPPSVSRSSPIWRWIPRAAQDHLHHDVEIEGRPEEIRGGLRRLGDQIERRDHGPQAQHLYRSARAPAARRVGAEHRRAPLAVNQAPFRALAVQLRPPTPSEDFEMRRKHKRKRRLQRGGSVAQR